MDTLVHLLKDRKKNDQNATKIKITFVRVFYVTNLDP